MHMSSYLLPFLDTGIDDIWIYLSILIDIPYLDGEKLSMKTFFLVVKSAVRERKGGEERRGEERERKGKRVFSLISKIYRN